LPTSAKLVGRLIPYSNEIRCRSASAFARTDPRERPSVIPRQLAPELVQEARLVRREARSREPEDQLGDVVRPVLRHGEQQQRQRPPRVVVEPAEQAEVDEAEASVGE
jgi:hypothetical protein